MFNSCPQEIFLPSDITIKLIPEKQVCRKGPEGPSWTWASRVPWCQRGLKLSWAALGKLLPQGWGCLWFPDLLGNGISSDSVDGEEQGFVPGQILLQAHLDWQLLTTGRNVTWDPHTGFNTNILGVKLNEKLLHCFCHFSISSSY